MKMLYYNCYLASVCLHYCMVWKPARYSEILSELLSLDFVINRFFMKLFKTNNLDVVKTCQQYFNFEMPSTLWTKRSASFENKFSCSENVSVKLHGTQFNTCYVTERG